MTTLRLGIKIRRSAGFTISAIFLFDLVPVDLCSHSDLEQNWGR